MASDEAFGTCFGPALTCARSSSHLVTSMRNLLSAVPGARWAGGTYLPGGGVQVVWGPDLLLNELVKADTASSRSGRVSPETTLPGRPGLGTCDMCGADCKWAATDTDTTPYSLAQPKPRLRWLA